MPAQTLFVSRVDPRLSCRAQVRARLGKKERKKGSIHGGRGRVAGRAGRAGMAGLCLDVPCRALVLSHTRRSETRGQWVLCLAPVHPEVIQDCSLSRALTSSYTPFVVIIPLKVQLCMPFLMRRALLLPPPTPHPLPGVCLGRLAGRISWGLFMPDFLLVGVLSLVVISHAVRLDRLGPRDWRDESSDQR